MGQIRKNSKIWIVIFSFDIQYWYSSWYKHSWQHYCTKPGTLIEGSSAVLFMMTLLVIVLTTIILNSWGRPPSKPGWQSISNVLGFLKLMLQLSGGSGDPRISNIVNNCHIFYIRIVTRIFGAIKHFYVCSFKCRMAVILCLSNRSLNSNVSIQIVSWSMNINIMFNFNVYDIDI